MGALQGLEIRRSSASLRGGGTGLRKMSTVAKYIDTSICIGCKACEVACQEWNDLPLVKTEQTGTYQTVPSLEANYWNLIQFREVETGPTGFAWLLRKDQCMHCDDPGGLTASPRGAARPAPRPARSCSTRTASSTWTRRSASAAGSASRAARSTCRVT